MGKAWLKARPDLVEDVQKSLDGAFCNLHLFIVGNRAEIRGSFPVLGADGLVLDRYSLRITFPDEYPEALPEVQEVAGRIPRIADRHIFTDSGNCCVLLEDARWESFPVGASFRTFLELPVHNYFLGQSLVERRENWPFDDWSHGGRGIYEYYSEALHTKDFDVVRRFVGLLALAEAKGHHECFCGSRSRLRDCCSTVVSVWRERVPAGVARRSLGWLQPKERQPASRRKR